VSKRDKKGEYVVGYGKPPAQHRFKKGQSGNPKGRPRKKTKEPAPLRFQDGHLDGFMEQEAGRYLQLHENGKPVAMTAMQAVVRSVIVEGIKGNRLAKKFALELLRQEEREALNRSRVEYKFFAQLKADGEATIARCKKQGIAPPRLFPHPDDILLDEAAGEVHLLGPMSADRAIPYERGALVRDWYLAYSVLEEKHGAVTTMECEGESAPAGHVLALIIDSVLPPSIRRHDFSTAGFLAELHRLTERRLRQRMKTLMAQIANMPDSIDERLAARERAVNAVGVIGWGLEKAVAGLTESQDGPANGGAPDKG
jgi:hypothetical protein